MASKGVASRHWGADRHFQALTEWEHQRTGGFHEYELASCLFCMDSALECWVFALNCIGFGLGVEGINSLDDARQLASIGPRLLLAQKPTPLGGLFPQVAELWRNERITIDRVIQNHDVSKHRTTTFRGGTMRSDVPKVLAEHFTPERFHHWPMESIYLRTDPKLPEKDHASDLKHHFDFCTEFERFRSLLGRTADLSVEDLRRFLSARR